MLEVQALAIANLLIEFELEYPQCDPAPPDWAKELEAARETITGILARLAPPPPAPDYHPLRSNFGMVGIGDGEQDRREKRRVLTS